MSSGSPWQNSTTQHSARARSCKTLATLDYSCDTSSALSAHTRSTLGSPPRCLSRASFVITMSSSDFLTDSALTNTTEASSNVDNDSAPLISQNELTFYYSGISQSPPTIVYRSSSEARPFVMPREPEAYRLLKKARGVYGHRLNAIWKETVGPMVRDLLLATDMAWTTIDVVRFLADKQAKDYYNIIKVLLPVVIWIGVRPGSVRTALAQQAANDILGVLARFDIHDVEVEFRESVYRSSLGPPLLESVNILIDKTAGVRGPLTPSLGLSIAAADCPDAQGTMSVYFAEGGDSDKLFGLTCRHLLLNSHNDDYPMRSAGRRYKDVQLLGNTAFDGLLKSIRRSIDHYRGEAKDYQRQIEILEKELQSKVLKVDIAAVSKELNVVRNNAPLSEAAVEDLGVLLETVQTQWSSASDRIIGHVQRAPPIAFNVQPGGFIEDWAVIALDTAKFEHLGGNYIDLGAEIGPGKFARLMQMRPSPKYYKALGRLRLCGMLSEELMRAPDMVDYENKPCVFVVKNGPTTGVTIGRANGIESFVRDAETGAVSMAWAVYNYDGEKSSVFSAAGDSGAMVADGAGRMLGMLIGGAGKTVTASDVAYLAPMCWLWPRVQAEFPHANLDVGTSISDISV